MPNLPSKLSRKILNKCTDEIRKEYETERNMLRARNDFSEELDYFIDTLFLYINPEKFKNRFSKPIAGFYCTPVPLELLDVFGYHPVRFCSGSLSVQKLSSYSMPVLSCPLIKSCLGSFYLEQSLEKMADMLIISNTCDWMVRLPEISQEDRKQFYTMDLPHIKEAERSGKRWLEEVYSLKRFLESSTKTKFVRKKFLNSILKYRNAWKTFNKLIELRRDGLISALWVIIIANAFMIDDVDSWSEKIDFFLSRYKKIKRDVEAPRIFLAGSPLIFPNLKLTKLIEEAGMYIAADNLCTSEKLFTVLSYKDSSEYGLLRAVAENYQLPCSCPTFNINETRIDNILATMKDHNINGLIYHVLKGCHPFDIESFILEKKIKERGFHYLKIETDYSKEDREVILTRLEAFKQMLR